jgi:tetratricopeptide (TPR) repeat protein
MPAVRPGVGSSLLLVVCAAVASPAVAAPDPAEAAKAREHFAQGSRLYDLSEYAKALEEFKEAYTLVDDPAFLFNIAQCHRKLGNLDEAITFYKRFLRRSTSSKNRPEVERRIAELEREQAAKPRKPPPTTTQAAPAPVAAAPPPGPDLAARPAPAGPPQAAISATPAPPAASGGSPFYRSGWFWAGTAVVVLGAAATVLVLSRGGAGGGPGCPDCDATGGISPP